MAGRHRPFRRGRRDRAGAPAAVDGVLSVSSGTSISTEGKEGDFDWMLVVGFRDRDALAAYLPHPEHRPVAEHIGANSERVVVFDVEGR